MVTRPLIGPILGGIERVRSSWGWFLVLGIVLMITGVICIAADVAATLATMLVFGWMLVISAIVELVHAFRVNTWNGFFLSLLGALLRGFTGYVLIRYPLVGAVGATLVLAAFFVVGGLFRTIGAFTLQLPRWGWAAFSGVVSVILGIVLLAQMPASSLWFIGFAIGVDMILEGASLVGLAMAIRTLPTIGTTTYERRAA